MAKEHGVTIYFDTKEQVRNFRSKAGARGASMSELGKRVLIAELSLDSPLFLTQVDDDIYSSRNESTDTTAPAPAPESPDPAPSPAPTLCECGAGEAEPGQTLCEGCATHYAWKAENEPGQPDPSPAIVDLSEGALETVV